jgi:hypothetical protein
MLHLSSMVLDTPCSLTHKMPSSVNLQGCKFVSYCLMHNPCAVDIPFSLMLKSE